MAENIDFVARFLGEQDVRRAQQAVSHFGRMAEQSNRIIAKTGHAVNEELLSMATRYLAVGAAVETAREAFVGFAGMDYKLRQIQVQTGATWKETEHLIPKFRAWALASGQSVDKVSEAFLNLRERARLSVHDTEEVFAEVQKGARATSTDLTGMSSAVASYMLNMGLAKDKVGPVMDLLSKASKDHMLSVADLARAIPQLSATMSDWGYKGEEGIARQIAQIAILQKTFGNTQDSAESLVRIFLTMGHNEELATKAGYLHAEDMIRALKATANRGEDVLTAYGKIIEAAKVNGFLVESLGFREQRTIAALQRGWKTYGATIDDLKHNVGSVDDAITKLNKSPQKSLDDLGTSLIILKDEFGHLLDVLGTNQLIKGTAHLFQGLADAIENVAHAAEHTGEAIKKAFEHTSPEEMKAYGDKQRNIFEKLQSGTAGPEGARGVDSMKLKEEKKDEIKNLDGVNQQLERLNKNLGGGTPGGGGGGGAGGFPGVAPDTGIQLPGIPGQPSWMPNRGGAPASVPGAGVPTGGGGGTPGHANYMGGALPSQFASVTTSSGLRFQAHPAAAPHMEGFVNELLAGGAPITSIGGQNTRRIAGSNRWSQHAYGNAIDINQMSRNVTTPAFRQWAQQNPDKLAAAEKNWGMSGGQHWRNPDFGHWEWGGPKREGAAAGGGGAPSGPLSETRARFAEELKNPLTRAKLVGLTRAEVGSQGPEAQQAFIESVMNRAAARGQTLHSAVSDRGYYPGFGSTAGTEGLYQQHIDSVLSGSNISGYATGNASGRVGFAGGPQTFSSRKERFGIEGKDRNWAARQRRLNTAPPKGSALPPPGPAAPVDFEDAKQQRSELERPIQMRVARDLGETQFRRMTLRREAEREVREARWLSMADIGAA